MTRAEQLARTWIDCWNEGRPDDIPLAPDFVHTSPFGRVEGRDTYMDWVKPLAADNVSTLTIISTVGSDDEAVVRFDMNTPHGVIAACDWVRIEGDEIAEIHSYYDATVLRPPQQGD